MIAYFDLPSGFSGDMCLSCLVDAGWDIVQLQRTIDALKLDATCTVAASRVMRNKTISATHVDVQTPQQHKHRHLHHIDAIITAADLSDLTKSRAIAVFKRLAAAEAKVHGTTVEKVHFHEVGALDAIIDIVGSCAGLEALSIDRVYASAIPLGWGWTDSEHGKIPLPAPATLEILASAGVPTRQSPGGGELVTPTGAAILAELATFAQPQMRMTRVANGTGTRDPQWPNVARMILGEEADLGGIVEMATNIDDMNPQLYAPVMEKLLAAGALDVWLTPVQMKKGRPGTVITVLAKASDETKLSRILLEDTTTLGVRVHPVMRHEAGREFRKIATAHGELSIKLKTLDGRVLAAVPEFDDCRRIASEMNISPREVIDLAMAEARKAIDQH